MALKELLSQDAYLDDEGDVLPFADIRADFDRMPVSNASIVQGMTNLDRVHVESRDDQLAEIDARRMREQIVADAAMNSAGAFVPIEELNDSRLALMDAVSGMSMYRGGEKGGYQSKDFNDRYTPHTPHVEAGARKNHQNLVNKTFPELLKASQLIEAGFERYDVEDMVNGTRMQLMREYGGPDNESARRKIRKRLRGK